MARARRSYSASERAELWERWKHGETVSTIARALDRAPGTIHCTLRERGGVAPSPRRRSARHLDLAEREEISRGIAAGRSGHQIAAALGRDPSTICREIARNGGRERYRAADADERAWDRGCRPQACKLARCPDLANEVAEMLEADWSPEQIAGHLKRTHPAAEDRRVSHETIYLTLFIQARGALRRELIKHLRRSKSLRRPHAAKRRHAGQGQIKDAVSIRERPAEAEDRAIPGHWEGDLIEGRRNTHVATLVERHSRFVMVVAVAGKDTVSVTEALAAQVKTLPAQLRRSLTWDRGTEMASHVEFSVATDLDVYFCDPQSPWQRGSNENTNGLLRQYLPRGTDMGALSQGELDAIALKLNTRPRKTLEFRTPAEVLDLALAQG
jgi:IS30 family transposase